MKKRFQYQQWAKPLVDSDFENIPLPSVGMPYVPQQSEPVRTQPRRDYMYGQWVTDPVVTAANDPAGFPGQLFIAFPLPQFPVVDINQYGGVSYDMPRPLFALPGARLGTFFTTPSYMGFFESRPSYIGDLFTKP